MNRRFSFFSIVKKVTIFISLVVGAFIIARLTVTARAIHKVGSGSPSTEIQAEIFSASNVALSQGLFYGIIFFTLIAIYSKPLGFVAKVTSVVSALLLYFFVRWGLVCLLDAMSGEPTVASLIENREKAGSVSFLVAGIIQATLLYLFWTKTKRRD